MKKNSGLLALILCAVLTMSGLSKVGATEVGLAWVGESGMATRVAQGFEKGMKELAPEVKIESHKDLATMDELSKLTATWQNEKQGMILLRSNAAKWLAQNPPTIPTFIGGCNHPAELGAVKNIQAPEGNITGVTYFLSIDTQFEIFKAVVPNLNSVLLLIEKDHPSSLIDQEGTKEVCKKLGIQYQEAFCTSVDDAIQSIQQYQGKVSAVVLGNQAVLIDGAEPIVKAAGKTPVLSYSEKPVKAGALGGFVADDVKLGYMLAQSVVDILKNGKKIKDVAVKVDPSPKFYVNAKAAQSIGIEIPYNILETATIVE